ncbi:MAG: hypothetical protein HQM16_06785 [Deltaproteobacteria bacterium]|nr:hypothetical protein [Deltaproteobacteria bacterium]
MAPVIKHHDHAHHLPELDQADRQPVVFSNNEMPLEKPIVPAGLDRGILDYFDEAISRTENLVRRCASEKRRAHMNALRFGGPTSYVCAVADDQVARLQGDIASAVSRIAGTMATPGQNLSDDVNRVIDEIFRDKPSEKQRFLYLLSVYHFEPKNPADVFAVSENVDLLSYRPVMLFYDYLVRELGYRFEGSFPALVNIMLKYDEMRMQLDYEIVSIAFKKISGQGSEISEVQLQEQVQREFEAAQVTLFNELSGSIKSDHFKNKLQSFLKKYPVPLSMDGILLVEAMDDASLSEVISSSSSLEWVEEQAGDLYAGNEMTLILAQNLCAEGFNNFIQLMGTLTMPRRSECLTLEFFERLQSNKDMADFLAFWNWLEKHFIGEPLPMASLTTLLSNWRDLRENNRTAADELYSDKTALQIKALAKELGQPVDENSVLEGISSFLWADDEISALRLIKQNYALSFTNINVSGIRQTIRPLIAEGLIADITSPDMIAIYTAAAKGGHIGSGPVDYLDSFLPTRIGLKLLEKKVPGSRPILKELVRTGVTLRPLMVLQHTSLLPDQDAKKGKTTQPEEESTSPLWPYFIKIILALKDNPVLIAQWQELSAVYGFGGDVIALKDWVDLPQSKRERALSSRTKEVADMLVADYDYKIDVAGVVSLADKMESDAAFKEAIETALLPSCRDFYRDNQKLFAIRADAFTDEHEDRVLAITRLYKKSLDNKAYLRWAKKWHSHRQDIGPYFTSPDFEPHLKILDDPNLGMLLLKMAELSIDQPLQAWNLHKIEFLLNDFELFNTAEFSNFAEMCFSVYGIYRWPDRIFQIFSLYKMGEYTTFLGDKRTHHFLAGLKKYGFSFFDDGTNSLEAACRNLKELFDTKGLLETAERIGTAYNIDLVGQIRKVETIETGSFLDQIAALRTSLKKRGFDFISELKTMIERGEAEVLFNQETLALKKFCEDNYGYRFSILDMHPLITISRNPEIIKAVKSPEMKEIITCVQDEIKKESENRGRSLGFNFSIAGFIVDLIGLKTEFQTLLTVLREKYHYSFTNPNDLIFLSDLLKHEEFVASLRDARTQQTFEKMQKEQGYAFKVRDIYVLFYLAAHAGLVDQIYDKRLDVIAERVFGTPLKHDLETRIWFEALCRDEHTRDLLTSEAFRVIKERMRGKISIMGGVANAGGYLQFLETPETLDFLEKVNFKFYGGAVRSSGFFESVPSLKQMVRLKAGDYILALSHAFEVINKKREIHLWYAFDPLDGPAWEGIIAQYTDINDFVKEVIAFSEKTGVHRLAANDIYLGLILKDRLITDRKLLESAVSGSFDQDIHRSDSNFDSYHSYNDPSKFTLMQLNKIHLLQQWLMTAAARDQLGRFIHKDVIENPQTELGSVIVLNPQGQLEHHEYPAHQEFNNGSYKVPPEARMDYAVSVATGHLHALKFNMASAAGPSGGRFTLGGDMTVAQVERTDAFVATSLSENEFAVHFYTAEGNVIFLGRYSSKPDACAD